MKAHLTTWTTLLAVIASLAITSAAAEPAARTSILYPVKCLVTRTGDGTLKAGASDIAVERAFGRPHQRPSRNVWIYRNFRALDREEANEQGCRTLVITFDSSRVVTMRLVNDQAVALIVAQAKAAPTVIPQALVARR